MYLHCIYNAFLRIAIANAFHRFNSTLSAIEIYLPIIDITPN